MEPVPEAERMEEFRSAPLPSVRLQSSPSFTFASPTPLSPRRPASPDGYLRKPPSSASSSSRRSMELPSSPVSPFWTTANALPYRPRTASPLSGSHARSRSTASPGSGFLPPGMARTRSMPGVTGSGHLQYSPDLRSSSPARQHRPPSLTTTRTPKKAIMEDVFPSSPTRVSVLHDADRRLLHERNSSPNLKGSETSPYSPSTSSSTPTSSAAPVPTAVATFPLVRSRRPSSPFRRLASAGSTGSPGASGSSTPSSSFSLGSSATLTPTSNPSIDVMTPTAANCYMAGLPESSSSSATSSVASSSSTTSSPSYRPLDAPPLSSYDSSRSLSVSSVPSTPTSTRSRSPSISSLETIPDSPDAEEAALEAERIAQLKADAEAAEGSGNGDAKGRSSLDVPARGRTMGFGSRDKRKRWSVCGAERRGDLDLETIWED